MSRRGPASRRAAWRSISALLFALVGCGGGSQEGASVAPPTSSAAPPVEATSCPALLERALPLATASDPPATKVGPETVRASLLRVPAVADEGKRQLFQATIEWPGGTGWGSSGRPGLRTVDPRRFTDLSPAVAALLGPYARREEALAKVAAFARASPGVPPPCGASPEDLRALSDEIARGADAREGALLRALNQEDHPRPADRVLLGYLTARSDRQAAAARGAHASVPPRAAGFQMLAAVAGDTAAPVETRALADYVLGRLFLDPERLGAALARTRDASLRLAIRRTTFDKWFGTGNLTLYDEAGLSEVLDELTQLGDDAWAYADVLRATALDPAGTDAGARFLDVATRCVRSAAARETRAQCARAIGARLAFYGEDALWETELPEDQLATVAEALVRIATVIGDHEQTLFAARVALARDPATESRQNLEARVATSSEALEQVRARAWREIFLARLQEVANRCGAPSRASTLTITSGARRATVRLQPSDGDFGACVERDGPRYFRSLPPVRATLRITLPRP